MFRRITFGGLHEWHEPPTSYQRLQRRHDAETEERAFADVLSILQDEYNIEARDLLFENQHGDADPIDHFTAMINPAWEHEPADALPPGRSDPVWNVPTTRYTPVPHHRAWTPLADAIEDRYSQSQVFGEVRLRQDGGEVHLDVFDRSTGVEPVDGESLTLGITSGHDYMSQTRLYATSVAYHDTGDGVGQVMRRLTDSRRRKHTGDADEDVAAWFDDAFAKLDDVSDTLFEVVAEAMEYEFPMGELPTSITGFYEHLGLPNREPHAIADAAAERAVSTTMGAYTGYHLYKAGMWAIEHHYDSRDTRTFREHVEAVNTLMFNPALAERRVLASLEKELREADEDASIYDYVDDEPSGTIEDLQRRRDTISDGVETFKTTREKIRKMLNDEGAETAEEADA